MNWMANYLLYIVIPLGVFLAVVAIGLSLRLIIYNHTKQRLKGTKWISILRESLWRSFLYWSILLGIYIAIQISILSPTVKRLVGEGVASLFVCSVMLILFGLSEKLVKLYLGHKEAKQNLISIILNVVKVIITTIGILTIFTIWGAPIEPFLLCLIIIAFIVGLTSRKSLASFVAWFEIVYSEHIKVGNFIKLESGETGYVEQISWTRTTIKNAEGQLTIIPNDRLLGSIIINYVTSTAENKTNDNQITTNAVESMRAVDTLTEREKEVLKLIGHGATNREIAQKLFISEHTVKSHLRSILSKLELRNRQQAAVYAERSGLVTLTNA